MIIKKKNKYEISHIEFFAVYLHMATTLYIIYIIISPLNEK